MKRLNIKNISCLKLLAVLLPAVILMSSCREKIELKLDSTYTRLVVEGSITDEAKAHRVVLSLSADYFTDEKPKMVTNALVEISDGQQVFKLTEKKPGVYETEPHVKGVPGREYNLTIKYVDVDNDGEYETYAATDLLKPVMILDSVVVEPQLPLTEPPWYKIRGWGQELPTPDDCYQWVYYRNGTLASDTLSKTIFVDDAYVNGSYIPGLTMFMFVKANPQDTILVETRSLSRPYYNFLVTFMLETVWNQGGAAGPPANIKGNINNGALGYFSAHSVSHNSAIVP